MSIENRNTRLHEDPQPAQAPIETDAELLDLLVITLERGGYQVQPTTAGDLPVLMAENADNVVAAAATVTVTDLVRAEPLLSRLLVARLGGANPDAKRWDGYVLLVTAQQADMTTSEALFGVTYNLRQVRRLPKTGVEPTLAGVARALRGLLPLTPPADVETVLDPLSALRERLMTDGVDPMAVQDAIARLMAVAPSAYAVFEENDGSTDEVDET
jgi:hypothetical protein